MIYLKERDCLINLNFKVLIMRYGRYIEAFVAASLVLASNVSIAQGNNFAARVTSIKAAAVTGVNDLCGEPIWDFPVNYTLVGEYDPASGATDAKVLTRDSCENDDLILASTTDPEFLADFGVPADADDRIKNIPLNVVPVIVQRNGTRAQVPFVDDIVESPALANGNSTQPYTLGEWLNARGKGKIVCRNNGTAEISFKLRNLVPNGLYTAWEVWGTLGSSVLSPVPLGGIPNALTADRRGFATYSRNLTECPMDIQADGRNMTFIDVIFHSDGNVTGGFPTLGGATTFIENDGSQFQSATPPGTIVQTQIVFPINVE